MGYFSHFVLIVRSSQKGRVTRGAVDSDGPASARRRGGTGARRSAEQRGSARRGGGSADRLRHDERRRVDRGERPHAHQLRPRGCATQRSSRCRGTTAVPPTAGRSPKMSASCRVPRFLLTTAASSRTTSTASTTVHASVRGTGCSSGEFDLFSWRSALDGKEIIDNWIPNQPWSNGAVGILGTRTAASPASWSQRRNHST